MSDKPPAVFRLTDEGRAEMLRKGIWRLVLTNLVFLIGLPIFLTWRHGTEQWPITAVIVAGAIGWMAYSGYRQLRDMTSTWELRIDDDEASLHWAGQRRMLVRRDELASVSEKPAGLLLTGTGYGRRLIILKGIDRPEEARALIERWGVPILPAPPPSVGLQDAAAKVGGLIFGAAFLACYTDAPPIVLGIAGAYGVAYIAFAARMLAKSELLDPRLRWWVPIIMILGVGAHFANAFFAAFRHGE